MLVLLRSFPPGAQFEPFLEAFLRERSKRHHIHALHRTALEFQERTTSVKGGTEAPGASEESALEQELQELSLRSPEGLRRRAHRAVDSPPGNAMDGLQA